MKTFTAIATFGLLCVGTLIFYFCSPIWQFDNLERNAMRVITAAELQDWATNFLARRPYQDGQMVPIAELRTNFPQKLLSISSRRIGPHVFLYKAEGTNWSPHLRIYWGSGFLGSKGFEVGPPTFEHSGEHRWAPGVYFYGSKD